MTPLVNYAANVTPAVAVANAVFGAVMAPELIQAGYGVPNGTLVSANLGYNGTGIPFPGPVYRALRRISWVVEGGAGITGGSLRIIGLRPDGNWHVISAGGLTIAANTNYYESMGAGVVAGSWTFNAGGIPLFGLGLQVGAGFAGGNINYIDVTAQADYVDPAFLNRGPVQL